MGPGPRGLLGRPGCACGGHQAGAGPALPCRPPPCPARPTLPCLCPGTTHTSEAWRSAKCARQAASRHVGRGARSAGCATSLDPARCRCPHRPRRPTPPPAPTTDWLPAVWRRPQRVRARGAGAVPGQPRICGVLLRSEPAGAGLQRRQPLPAVPQRPHLHPRALHPRRDYGRVQLLRGAGRRRRRLHQGCSVLLGLVQQTVAAHASLPACCCSHCTHQLLSPPDSLHR